MTTLEFSGEEYLELSAIASEFLNCAKPADGKPSFRIYCGGVGSGKTTVRRQQCATGFVQLELSDILSRLRLVLPDKSSRHSDYAQVLLDIILQDSLATRRNIAIEVIGDSEDILEPLVRKLIDLGYGPDVRMIDCDFSVARDRHLKASANDPEYISSFFCEGAVLMTLFSQLGLDKAPLLAQEHRRFGDE